MKDKIKEFLKLTQFYDLTKAQLNALIDGDGENSVLSSQFKRHFNIEELEERILPFYEKNLTETDLDQILVFLKSPIGQTMIRVNSEISTDINNITNDWFVEKYEQAIKELQ